MATKEWIPILPYSKIVGHKEDVKLALEVAYIAGARIGGVLLRGDRGTGKSTIVRAFAQMMYGELPITLPINATEDRVVGGLKIDKLLKQEEDWQAGLLEQADGNILYVDEVNLLDDHIVNLILDTAATGILPIQRQGKDEKGKSTKFTLVGTMNPEEGYLRAQLRDRFGLMVDVITDTEQRAKILQTMLAFDDALYENGDKTILEQGEEENKEKREALKVAQKNLPQVEINGTMINYCVQLAAKIETVGHRGAHVLALAAKALAARDGESTVTTDHIRRLAPMALAHRRQGSPHWGKEDNEIVTRVLTT